MPESAVNSENLIRLMGRPDRRPLYLDARASTHVFLDGPALRILVAGQAERSVPLRRLSRIVTNARAEFTTDALLACADRGITLVFLTEDGEVRARILGTPGERQELRQRLLDLMAQPDWRTLYNDWLYAVERQTVNGVRRKLRAPETIGMPRPLRAWIDAQAIRLSDADTAAKTRQWLAELGFAWMLHHGQQLGLGAQSELLHDGWPDLTTDLAALFEWELEPVRLGWLWRRYRWRARNSARLHPATRRDMVRLFERNGTRLGRAGRTLTNRLHYWLVELA
ncbi:MAG: CRISPR-associated endonuclease Cas1 [Gammaproteobacteria bacterium]